MQQQVISPGRPAPVAVRVMVAAGVYTTSAVHGQRASSTASAEHAVRSLARKLIANGGTVVRRVGEDGGVELWEIIKPANAYVAGVERRARDNAENAADDRAKEALDFDRGPGGSNS
jgi:hypothetical protein